VLAARPAIARQANHVIPVDEVNYDATGLACDSCDSGEIAWDGAPTLAGPTCCVPVWASFEYLLWWERDSKFPPLVTTSPNGTDRDDAGVLGVGSTSILFGGDEAIESGSLSGGRLTVGLWLDSCQGTSVVGRAFGIEDHGVTFAAASDGSQILARPFFNAFTGEQDSLLLGFPEEILGDIQITQDIQTRGAQAMFRHLYKAGCNYRVDIIYGYRYLGVDETLEISNSLEFIDPSSNIFGNTIQQLDVFEVENEFHGGDLGLAGHSEEGRWTLDFLGTVALGSMKQRATLRGNTVTTPDDGDPVTVNGGLLTQQSNIGSFKDDPFTVVPEFTVTLGYLITPRLDMSIGYTFLYVNHVSRPGELIDTAVNLTQQTGQLEGPARPAFEFQDSDYWLQGLNFGLNLRF
jgi:hypothetical protein